MNEEEAEAEVKRCNTQLVVTHRESSPVSCPLDDFSISSSDYSFDYSECSLKGLQFEYQDFEGLETSDVDGDLECVMLEEDQ
jgi:hypothetical protein